MKHFIKTLLCVCVCVCVISCQKDNTDQLNLSKQRIVDEAHGSIADFVNLAMLHQSEPTAGLRSSSLYTPSQALYYLNHGLNAAYCRPNENYATYLMVSDTLFIPLIDTATMVLEDELLDLFDEIADMAGELYYGVADTIKQPFHFEIRPYGDIEEDYIPVIATFIMGHGACSNLNPYPYTSTDQWVIFPEGGNCCFNESGNDAMDHWRCDLNANLNYRDKNTYYYFTNRYSVFFSPFLYLEQGFELPYLPVHLNVEGDDLINPNDPTQYDNYYEYLLFYNSEGSPNFHTCLSQAEMNWHYEEMATLSMAYEPQGKVTGLHGVGMEHLLATNSKVSAVMRVDYFTRNVLQTDAYPLPVCCP